MTKMTDEELTFARKVADALSEDSAGSAEMYRLLAHIAALTAERDAFSRRASIAEQNERDAAGEWRAKCERLTAERDDARAVLARTSNDLNATIGGLTADLERAEADNATLLDGIRAYHAAWKEGRDGVPFAALLRLANGVHPGAAILEVAGLVRQYQHRDEATIADTFQRLMNERARIAEMVQPDVHAAMLERMRALEAWIAKAVKRISGFAHADACNVEDHYDKEETEGCVCALALLDDVPNTADAEASTPPVSELDGLEEDVALNASKETHTTNDVLECVSWCRACNENRGRGLNPDGTAPPPPQTDDLAAIEQHRENEEAAFDRMANPGLSPEPTMAEAFATVRAGVNAAESNLSPSGKTYARRCGLDALSLLERRMGEWERAARDVIHARNEYGPSAMATGTALDALAAALRVKP